MKEEQDYIRDLTEIRSMMERSTKFLSLSGLSGVLMGIYALAGAFIAYRYFHFSPEAGADDLSGIIGLACVILALALGTAVLLSYKKAGKRGEHLWNTTAKRLVINMGVPLVAGGLLILILISRGLIEFIAPFSLLFYGLALYNASKFTYEEVRSLGLILIGLGLAGSYLVGYGLLFWALGFGVLHIIYGIYMHYRYERENIDQ